MTYTPEVAAFWAMTVLSATRGDLNPAKSVVIGLFFVGEVPLITDEGDSDEAIERFR
ncbi:hypothetical protein [Paraburkholderia tropica]|uniref:hypothetical protein n=1 Tax=Paraburkholderia tropica TaxID=92647 RepID=UPI002AAFE753|nr:hypothetical protein [Paraburkholderia tropica]